MPPRGSWLPSGPGQKCGLVAGRGKCNGFANTGATHLPSLFLGTWQRQRRAPGGGGGGPRQAGRPCSPALPHLPACHQLPVNQVTVLPTLPRTPPPSHPYLSLHLGGAVSELRFPWAEEGEQADRPPVVRAQGPGPEALPILRP